MDKGNIVLSTTFTESFIIERWVGPADGVKIPHWEERQRFDRTSYLNGEAQGVMRTLFDTYPDSAWRIVRSITTTVVTEA